jgi:release factor glutamine methyltransferase
MEIYEPDEDSFLILKHIEKYAQGKRVLDMGTGSGILAYEAKKYALFVTAVDINPEAVKSLKGVEGICSNLFEKVGGKFDLILFNPPYLPRAEGGTIATDGGQEGHETISRFLLEAKHHLSNQGIILLVFSSFSGPVEEIALANGYEFRIIETQHHFYEKLYLCEIKWNS